MDKIPALFVIGRFRSGTTLAWNILRQTGKTCAYYEPFNDNLLEHLRSDTKPMLSHAGVDTYWDAYQKIKNNIAVKFDRRFGITRLCLGKESKYEELQEYIEWLISSCKKGQLPVLQFNRADFRIPWLKSRFPDVPILYIYRDPREQWLSIVKEQPEALQKNAWLNTGYDLLIWSANLLPFLPNAVFSNIRHSYDRHYILWKISYEIGMHYAEHSISLDNDLHRDTDNGIRKILRAAQLDIKAENFHALVASKQDYSINKSLSDWFKESELHCNQLLEDSGLLKLITEDRIFDSETILNQALSDVLNDTIYPVCNEISMHRRNAILSSSEYRNKNEHTAALVKSIKDAEEYVQSLKDSNDKKDSEIEEERNSRHRLQDDASKQIEILEAELDKLGRVFANERAYREKENSDAKKQIMSLENSLKDSEKYTHSLEKSNSRKDHEIEEERSARISIQEDSIKHIESLKAELERFKQEFINEQAYREKEYSDADNQIKSLKSSLEVSEKYSQSLVTEQKKLEKVIVDLSEARDKESVDARLQIEALTDSINAARVYTVSLENELIKTQQETKSQHADILSLNERIERKLTEYDELASKFENHINEADSKFRMVSEKLEAEEARIHTLNSKVENLQEYLGRIESNRITNLFIKLFRIDRIKS